MHRSLILAIVCSCAIVANAGACTWSQTAIITDDARVNSEGKQLSTMGQVLSQERYQYWAQLLPDKVSEIRGSAYWEPEGIKDATFHLATNRKQLAILDDKNFAMSSLVREAFWSCSQLKIRMDLDGRDCGAWSDMSITKIGREYCFD